MIIMATNYTRSKIHATTVPGLYIEIKEPEWYMDNYGIDMTQALFDILQKNGLETIEKCTNAGIPVIIQSFSDDALKKWATMSDLPLVRLVSTSDYGTLNFEDIASFAHGVGPDSKYVMYWPDDVVHPADPNVDPTTPS